MRGAGRVEEKPIAAPAVRLLGLVPGRRQTSCGMPAAYPIFRKICHVVADSETWPNAAAVARFPRNGASGKNSDCAEVICPIYRLLRQVDRKAAQGLNRVSTSELPCWRQLTVRAAENPRTVGRGCAEHQATSSSSGRRYCGLVFASFTRPKRLRREAVGQRTGSDLRSTRDLEEPSSSMERAHLRHRPP
jgi:hypothetical protein